MDNRKVYINKLESQINLWKKKIEELESRKETAEAELRSKYDDGILTLRKYTLSAQKKLEEIQNTSDEAWHSVGNGLQNAWDETANTIERSLSSLESIKESLVGKK